MRIGIVCPYDLGVHGGVQQQCLGLASVLTEMGEDVRVVGPGIGQGWTSVGPTRSIPINGSRAPIVLSPGTFRVVRDALSDVDVVHIHEPLVPATGWAALLSDRPSVATFHADPTRLIRVAYRLGAPILRKLLHRRLVTAVSRTAASALPASIVDEIIPNGVDVAALTAAPSQDRAANRVVFVGRDEPRKGLDVLLDAWPRVREGLSDAELVVIGSARGPIDGVDFRGRVSEEEKRTLLGSSAVAVAPNLWGESFGIVVVEMMAAGCATVVSDIPAFRDVAGDGALVVPRADRLVLADAILRLLRSQDERIELSSAGVAASQRFGWEHVAAAYRRRYRMIGDPGGTGSMGVRKE